MYDYFSTFVVGTGGIVEAELLRRDRKAKITDLYDGLVVYRSSIAPSAIKGLRFFNNSFGLLERFPGLRIQEVKGVMRRLATKEMRPQLAAYLGNRERTFRIIVSRENKYVAADRQALQALEARISKSGKFRVNIQRPDNEFWLLMRRENVSLFGVRLTDEPVKKLSAGELRHEISNIMCLAAGVKKHEIVCDPFAGYGSIPLECLNNFSPKEILVSDIDSRLVSDLALRLKRSPTAQVKRMDALHMSYAASSIDRIVTDPPWGLHEPLPDPIGFYAAMLKEFARVLRRGGQAALLMGNKDAFEKAFLSTTGLTPIARHDVLISGKKAAIYVMRRD